MLCCGCLLDLCGLGALGAGLAAANFPPPLAVRSLTSFLLTVLHHHAALFDACHKDDQDTDRLIHEPTPVSACAGVE